VVELSLGGFLTEVKLRMPSDRSSETRRETY